MYAVSCKQLGCAESKLANEGFVAKARGVPGAAIDFDYVGGILLGLAVAAPLLPSVLLFAVTVMGASRASVRTVALYHALRGRTEAGAAAADRSEPMRSMRRQSGLRPNRRQ